MNINNFLKELTALEDESVRRILFPAVQLFGYNQGIFRSQKRIKIKR